MLGAPPALAQTLLSGQARREHEGNPTKPSPRYQTFFWERRTPGNGRPPNMRSWERGRDVGAGTVSVLVMGWSRASGKGDSFFRNMFRLLLLLYIFVFPLVVLLFWSLWGPFQFLFSFFPQGVGRKRTEIEF